MMDHEIYLEKKALRQKMREERDLIPPDWKERYDQKVNDYLIKFLQENKIQSIHSYLPIGSEIDILPTLMFCLDQGIRVICPKALPARKLSHHALFSMDEMEKGYFGTRHPASPAIEVNAVDLVLVPGLAFDKMHNRLGYGSGYYDAFLKSLNTSHTIGLAYPFQIVEEVPHNEMDTPLSQILCFVL